MIFLVISFFWIYWNYGLSLTYSLFIFNKCSQLDYKWLWDQVWQKEKLQINCNLWYIKQREFAKFVVTIWISNLSDEYSSLNHCFNAPNNIENIPQIFSKYNSTPQNPYARISSHPNQPLLPLPHFGTMTKGTPVQEALFKALKIIVLNTYLISNLPSNEASDITLQSRMM